MESNSQSKIILIKATHADIEKYISIESKVASKTYATLLDEKSVLGEMAKGPVYMVKRGEDTVGTVSYEIKEDGSVYLSGLAVDPEYQGQGIGRDAIEKVLSEVSDAPKVWLVTHPENAKAVSLYESLGFKITDKKDNYFGDGEPRIVLTLVKSK